MLLGALLIAGSAAAAPTRSSRGQLTPGSKIEVNGKTFVIGDPDMLKSANIATPRKSRRVVEVPEVIKKPEGTPQEYSKTSGGYYFYGNYNAYQDAAQAATIYWDGDDAYIYNILSYKETDTYVKGKREGNKLVVPLNKPVDQDQDYYINLGLLRTDIVVMDSDSADPEDPDTVTYIFFLYNEDYDTVEYTISDDGELELQIPNLPDGTEKPDDGYIHLNPADYGFPDYCLGFYYTDDDTWTGDGDIFQTYEEFNYQLVDVPEDAVFNYYSYVNSDDNGVLVYVAKVGDKLYFKGLSAFAPEAVFMANLVQTDKGLEAQVPQFQYIGKSQDGYYNLLTRTAKTDRWGNIDLSSDDVPAIFSVETDENGVIISLIADNQNNIPIFNYADDFYDPYDEFPGVKLKYQETLAGEPVAPHGAYFEDHSKWLGAYWLFFYLDMFTEQGTILDVNELYYRIYVNGEPFEFKQHNGNDLKGNFVTMYLGMQPATTLVPFTFYNGQDIFYDEYHLYYVGFYDVEGFETVGVQTVYTYGGEEKCSEIQTINVKDVVKVEGIEADIDAAPVYYNLQGQRVANPMPGQILIRVINGKAEKVLVK